MKTKFLSIFTLAGITLSLLTVQSCDEEDDDNNNASTNQAPTCSITNPSFGDEITQGETVTISVEAEDEDDNLKEVRFYVDGIAIGSAASFPYSYEWETGNVSEGSHTIKAVAIDDEQAQAEDDVEVSITNESTGGNYLINEDFENYSVNEFPSSSDWSILYAGTGEQDQYITNEYSNSGSKSIRLSGTSSWRSEIIQSISVDHDDKISFEVSFYAVPGDPGGRCSLNNPEEGSWGTMIRGIRFYDNTVSIAGEDIYSFEENEWVTVIVEYNQVDDYINVWVNNEQFLTEHQVEDNSVEITHFSISTRYSDGACINYWDDVRVIKD